MNELFFCNQKNNNLNYCFSQKNKRIIFDYQQYNLQHFFLHF